MKSRMKKVRVSDNTVECHDHYNFYASEHFPSYSSQDVHVPADVSGLSTACLLSVRGFAVLRFL